jgi:hypothetical protein
VPIVGVSKNSYRLKTYFEVVGILEAAVTCSAPAAFTLRVTLHVFV